MGNIYLSGAWALEAFQRGGVDVETLALSMPEEFHALLYQTDSITPEAADRLLQRCAELSHNPHFGLSMNEYVDISMYGIFGYLLLNSHTVSDLFRYIDRYYEIFYATSAAFTIQTQEDPIALRYHDSSLPGFCGSHLVEWSLGFVPTYLTSKIGNAGFPEKVQFMHSAPANTDKLKSVFGPNLYFDQSENLLSYPHSILKTQLSDVSPSLLRILRKEAETMLKTRRKYSNLDKKIRLLILENLEQHEANANDIAKTLNMTLSTFKRRLAQEGVDFRAIKQSVKNSIAQKMLQSSDADIFEIAKKVGFADQSSFTRFFIRCNGMSPRKYRRQVAK